MTTTPIELITIEEFETLIDLPENSDRLLELVDGEICEKMPTEEHGEVTGNIFAPLRGFVVAGKMGRVGVEVRHRKSQDRRNSLMPDISFIAGNRPRVTEGSVPQMPDFAIEVRSPTDSWRILRQKATYYLANGTRLVWLVDPRRRLVFVLTPDSEEIFGEGDILTGGEVLPGFTLAVSEIFKDHLAE